MPGPPRRVTRARGHAAAGDRVRTSEPEGEQAVAPPGGEQAADEPAKQTAEDHPTVAKRTRKRKQS